MLVPILDEVIGEAAESGIRNILIGMAHRGRLNVMAHVLNKPYAQILAEFKEPVSSRVFREDMAWTGDVKYHAGAHRAIKGGRAMDVAVSMPPNPSHLEAIDPVVEGMARAAGTVVDAAGAPTFDPTRSLPILIHGDAAFPGQGVVAETLNLSRLPGYQTGGTIHIIVNNQLGFTTGPEAEYSTSYASGLARGFKIPIVHVNADDPEACVEAARLAFAYRATVSARLPDRFDRLSPIRAQRRGRAGVYAAGDVQKIASHPTVREIWATDAGSARRNQRRDRRRARPEIFRRAAGGAGRSSSRNSDFIEPQPEDAAARRRGQGGHGRADRAAAELNAALLRRAARVHHPSQARTRPREARPHARQPDERTVDWAAAEELALASILADGISIRLTGEDVERGTFSHRHAVLHDAEDRRAPRAAAGAAPGARRIRDPQQPADGECACSASSSATTSRSRLVSSSGKRSTATSSTAPR